MDGKRIYSIQINGVSESINAVEALNKQLNDLESRMNSLEKNGLKINGGSKSSLSEEVALQKELNKLKKEEAAQQRLVANEYANTMKGMKQNLSDLKSVINTTDLGDTENIQKMTKDANELTNKLKEMEQAYGQFGRNVGNYANGVAQGLQKVNVIVGGSVRTFDNARQASKTLNNELKAMAVNGQQDTKEFKDLRQAINEMESTMNDAKKPMDNIMDTMESFVAIASASKGIGAFFGVDQSEIQKSIQQLIGLQTALKGIQSISKQIETREGVGKWIAPFTVGIDKATTKVLAFNKALLGTSTAGKLAAKGINLFSKALKALISIGVIAIISIMIDKVMDLVESFKKLDKAAEDAKEVEEAVAKAYAEGTAKLLKYQTVVKNFNGTKAEEKKLVEELNKELGDGLGTYKSLAEWQDALVKKGEDYIKMLKLQAKAQASFNLYVKALEDEQKRKNMSTEDYATWLNQLADFVWTGWGDNIRNRARVEGIQTAKAYREGIEEQMLADQKEYQDFMEKNGVGTSAPQIEKNAKKVKNTVEEVQRTLNQLEIRLMKDGLNKRLRELDEEERQTINKLKENGRLTAEEMKKIQRSYALLRQREIQEYLNNIEERIKESAKNISEIQFDVDTSHINNTIDSLENLMSELEKLDMTGSFFEPLTSSRDLNYKVDDQLSKSFKSTYEITSKFYESLIKDLISYQKDEQSLIDENIKEEKKKQRQAENDRYSTQMSGLTASKKLTEEGMKAIVDKYGEMAEDGAIIIKAETKDILDSYKTMQAELITINDQIETAKKQHKEKLKEITKASNNEIKKNELDTDADISATQEKYYNLQISNFREFLSKLNDEANQNPVVGKNWGIVNITQTKKNYDEIINAAQLASKQIENEIDKISHDPLLTDQAKSETIRQLEDILRSFKQGEAVMKDASKNLVGDFINSVNQYIQVIGQSIQTVMSSLADYQQYQFDKEQEELDMQNYLLEEKLDEQQRIIEEHKSAIDSIEDELATARGDRRQHLIDQINAEIEAQRAAQREEDAIQKQKERAEKKQADLDYRRQVAQWENNKLSILVSTAMATANGLATQPFWPVGVAMGALATALGMVQYALAEKQKPQKYASGGVIAGASHANGGVKVLGGQAEVEGGEFITNKRTTAQNVDLLEYINSKKTRVDISDLIDFYSGNKVKKNIVGIKTKFADGGTLPTLRNDININDRLVMAMEDYSNRPVVVSVVDINNRQAAVRNVQVLAGIENA